MIRRGLAGVLVAGIAAVLLASFAAFSATAHAEVAIPVLKARVTDLTGTLSAEQQATLEQRLAAFEAEKGSQIAVLLLPSTRPEEIEQYSIRVFDAWKIGRKGTDDGVILIVAKNDRRLRIEVGYGLEGAIPDAIAKRVISELITPRFKAGDFYGGVSAGVNQLIKLVDGENLPPPSGDRPGSGSGGGSVEGMLAPAIMFLFVAGAVLRSMLGRFPGAVATGLIGGAVGWVLFGFAIGALGAIAGFILTLVNVSTRGGGFGTGGRYGGSSGGSSSWGGGGGGFGGGGRGGGGGQGGVAGQISNISDRKSVV